MTTEYQVINPYNVDTSNPNQTYDTVVDSITILNGHALRIVLRILPVAE